MLEKEVDDLKEINNKLNKEYEYAQNQINSLNLTIESIKKDFAFKNQRLQEIFDSKIKERTEQDILIAQLREQIRELHLKVEELENKTVLFATENQRLSFVRMELTKQLDSKLNNLTEQEVTYIQTLERTLEDCEQQKSELLQQGMQLKQENKKYRQEIETNQKEKQQYNQQQERLQYQLNVNINSLQQKYTYIDKLEEQINQQNNTNSINLQQVHNSYHRKISEIKSNNQLNNNNNLLSDDSRHLSFLNSVSFQDIQELKREKASKDYQYNCLLVSFEDQKRQIDNLINQKDMLTQEIMLLKELNQQLVFQLNQNTYSTNQVENNTENKQVQQQIALISENLDKLQKANDLLIQENETLRNECCLANSKLTNLAMLSNSNKDYICSCRGSNRLQVSVVEGEMEISDLKDYFGQINQTNNANLALQPTHINKQAKKYNLKINQCQQSFGNSPTSQEPINQYSQQFQENNQMYSDQRKFEDIQNISGSNSFVQEKKRASSFINSKDIRKSITDSSIRQHKSGESCDNLGSFQCQTEHQY